MTVTENKISESLVKTLPGSAYSDPELFAREQELIFERMWFCAASSAEIGKAGRSGPSRSAGRASCSPAPARVRPGASSTSAATAASSLKAINAARMGTNGDGSHKVSLDQAIKTMRDTGRDMKVKDKETARGGLAVNVIEC